MADIEDATRGGMILHVPNAKKTSITVAPGREGVLVQMFPAGHPEITLAETVITYPQVEQLIAKLQEFCEKNQRVKHYILEGETGRMFSQGSEGG